MGFETGTNLRLYRRRVCVYFVVVQTYRKWRFCKHNCTLVLRRLCARVCNPIGKKNSCPVNRINTSDKYEHFGRTVPGVFGSHLKSLWLLRDKDTDVFDRIFQIRYTCRAKIIEF